MSLRHHQGKQRGATAEVADILARSPDAPPAPPLAGLTAWPTKYAFMSPADPVDVLPPSVFLTFDENRQMAREKHAQISGISDQITELRIEHRKAQLRRQELINDFRLREDDAQVAATDKILRRTAAQIENLEKRKAERSEDWAVSRGLVQNMEQLIASLNGRRVIEVDRPAPKLHKGETPADAVTRCRQRVRELQEDEQKYRTAPIKADHARKLMRDEIERHARLGAPDIRGILDHRGSIYWPRAAMAHRGGQRINNAVGEAEDFDGLAVLLWLHKDATIAALDREIDQLADDSRALSDEERKRLLTEVAHSILETERDEEHFVRLAGVSRRRDANPEAVLGIVLA